MTQPRTALAAAVAGLALSPEGAETWLRAFELVLLQELGWLPDLAQVRAVLARVIPYPGRFRLALDSFQEPFLTYAPVHDESGTVVDLTYALVDPRIRTR